MSEPNPTAPKTAIDPNDTPEDVASLYSWANLHGAKYRDFSASRAQAREEARLRAEEAAAAERQRQEEEAERRRQEEAQIVARLAAEAAEAARQAEAERLAEIARQAEVERQAVLAAQEAQRQALQQRGWQSQASDSFQVSQSSGSTMPLPGAPAEYQAFDEAQQQFQEPAFESPRPESLATPDSTRFSQAGQFFPPAQTRRIFTSGSVAPNPPVPTANYVEPQIPQHVPEQASRAPLNPPVQFQDPRSSKQLYSQAPQGPGVYTDPEPPLFESAPSYFDTPQESYPPSPWSSAESRDDRELREQNFRPAWLAPEVPARQQVPTPFSQPNQQSAPPKQYVPMYAQPVGQAPVMAQNPTSNQNQPPAPAQQPNQVPSYNPSPVEDTLVGSRDSIANRWYALKSVFDPQSASVEQVPVAPPARVPVLAVFSLAGGVGKTSLVASLGRALSSRGERVLLVDTAAYGLLPFFFGARDQRPGQLRTFNPPGVSIEAPIQLVTLDPEAQLADPQSQDANQDRSQDWLAQQVAQYSRGANRVIIDLPTASGATTRRVLRLAPTVLVPVVPDMNSVVSVGAIEAFFRHSGNIGGKQILPYYVLNQFDYSLPLHLDVREILREQIGDRLLPFALRRSPAVSEALAEGMTVIDYAPNAVVAEDYASLAGWVRSLSAPATQSYRGVRWSER